MHRDFHYSGTYLAARGAGFNHESALKIGEYAELVDETWNSRQPGHKNYVADHDTGFYWEPEQFFGVKHKRGSMYSSLPKVQRSVTAVKTAKFMQKGEGRKPWFILSWSAFHFLPNLDPVGPPVERGAKPNYRQRYAFITSATPLNPNSEILKKEQMLICYPDSTLAKAMVEDTKKAIDAVAVYLKKGERGPGDIYQHFQGTVVKGNELINDFEKLNNGFSPLEFILSLVGVRLHVFADLWAHQGHAAARSPRINDACRTSFHVSHSTGKWFREVDSESHKKTFDLKDKALPSSHYGHANAYTYPDLPTYRYRFVRPFDYRIINRDNPIEYAKAYSEMYKLLKYLFKKVISENSSSHSNQKFHPDNYSQEFWRKLVPSVKEAHEKAPRNKKLREKASVDLNSDQKKQFIADDANADFGLIEFMHERYKKNNESNLPYFSLAARYHLNWFENQMRKSPLGGNYPNWVNTNLGYEPDLIENFIKTMTIQQK